MTVNMMLAPLMAAHSQQLCSPENLNGKLVVRAHRTYQILSLMWDRLPHTPFTNIDIHRLACRVAESVVSDKFAFFQRVVKCLRVLFLPQAALFLSLLLNGPFHMYMFAMRSQPATYIGHRHAEYLAVGPELCETWKGLLRAMR